MLKKAASFDKKLIFSFCPIEDYFAYIFSELTNIIH